MVAIGEPITYDLTIYQGTDHEWFFRRLREDDTPIVPSAVEAQIRNKPDGNVWVELDATFEPDGWIKLSLPATATETPVWYERENGAWDMKVTLDGKFYRWVMGAVNVSQEITRDDE